MLIDRLRYLSNSQQPFWPRNYNIEKRTSIPPRSLAGQTESLTAHTAAWDAGHEIVHCRAQNVGSISPYTTILTPQRNFR